MAEYNPLMTISPGEISDLITSKREHKSQQRLDEDLAIRAVNRERSKLEFGHYARTDASEFDLVFVGNAKRDYAFLEGEDGVSKKPRLFHVDEERRVIYTIDGNYDLSHLDLMVDGDDVFGSFKVVNYADANCQETARIESLPFYFLSADESNLVKLKEIYNAAGIGFNALKDTIAEQHYGTPMDEVSYVLSLIETSDLEEKDDLKVALISEFAKRSRRKHLLRDIGIDEGDMSYGLETIPKNRRTRQKLEEMFDRFDPVYRFLSAKEKEVDKNAVRIFADFFKTQNNNDNPIITKLLYATIYGRDGDYYTAEEKVSQAQNMLDELFQIEHIGEWYYMMNHLEPGIDSRLSRVKGRDDERFNPELERLKKYASSLKDKKTKDFISVHFEGDDNLSDMISVLEQNISMLQGISAELKDELDYGLGSALSIVDRTVDGKGISYVKLLDITAGIADNINYYLHDNQESRDNMVGIMKMKLDSFRSTLEGRLKIAKIRFDRDNDDSHSEGVIKHTTRLLKAIESKKSLLGSDLSEKSYKDLEDINKDINKVMNVVYKEHQKHHEAFSEVSDIFFNAIRLRTFLPGFLKTKGISEAKAFVRQQYQDWLSTKGKRLVELV